MPLHCGHPHRGRPHARRRSSRTRLRDSEQTSPRARLRPFPRDDSVERCRLERGSCVSATGGRREGGPEEPQGLSSAAVPTRRQRRRLSLERADRLERAQSRTALPDASALRAPQIGMSDINDPPPPYTTDAPPPYVAQNPAHGAPPPYVAQNPAHGAPATGVSSTSGTAHAVHNGHHRGLARVRRLFRTVERKIRGFFKT
ncbi:hypothetical protein B0H15DRAFT_957309 [Mycena belliarum]|uniref:Uncharacterized protein n=1 Tax=Mycena belliarum TaxID=1033014 RepID=A0AAD6TN34_9AGAR|nr:hypothetical protein B0H15DRAFT_957309 [Mycena belliae]